MTSILMNMSYGNYYKLSFSECMAITYYMDENDPSDLEDLIKISETFSDSFRLFLADFVSGKVKRPPGKKSTNSRRNYDIYYEVEILLEQGKNLTSNRSSAGALAIVAERYSMTEDAVQKAHQKLRDTHEEHDRVCREEIDN